MATQIEEWASVGAPGRWGAVDGGPTSPESLAALVVALEQTLLAAHRLLGALDSTAGRHARAASHLAAARALAEVCTAPGDLAATAPVPATGVLSRRECEVLRLLATGRSTRQAAQALYLSPRTIQRHIANAYLKIGAHNKAEATAYACRHGLA